MNNFLHIFDFDYTLYETFEYVKVWSPRGEIEEDGNLYTRLNPTEFHHYDLGQDEYINEASFSAFKNVNWNKALPIEPTLFIFNNVEKKMILTARPQEAEFSIREKLAGDFPIIGLGDGNFNCKIDFIKNIKDEKVILYEDSSSCIEACCKNSISNVKVKKQGNRILLTYNMF